VLIPFLASPPSYSAELATCTRSRPLGLSTDTDMARRIVPELISPSQAVAIQPAFESVAEQPLNLRFDLKEQAELAKTMLEPGRKIFVDISQDSKVNWRKVCISCCCKAVVALVDRQFVEGICDICSCRRLLEFRKQSHNTRQRRHYLCPQTRPSHFR